MNNAMRLLFITINYYYSLGDRFGQICAKVGLVYFLKKFRVEKCHRTQDPLVLDPKSPFMTPVEGLQLRVKKLV